MKFKKRSLKYFFRSFGTTLFILGLIFVFVFSVSVSWKRMQQTAYGKKDAKPIEITSDEIRILDFYIYKD